MPTKENNSSQFLNYMDESLPPWKWLGLMLLLSSIAVVIFLGVGSGNNLFYTFVLGSSNHGQFKVDPLLSEYIPNKLPLFYKLVSSIYDIPFYHLLFGILVKGLMVVAYFSLAWKITGSTFASLISVFILFGLFKFEIGSETILNLKLPFLPDSMEFRHWCYLSFRQASGLFIVIGIIYFLGRKFVLSSIFLAFGLYCHPHNGMIIFAALNLALLICILFWEDRISVLRNWLKFLFPFIIVSSPYLLNALSTFSNVTPIPFLEFWGLTLKNEPDDASTLFALNHYHPPYILSFYLSSFAVFLHFLFKSKIPKIKLNFASLTSDTRDLVWPVILAPWALVLFGCLWESGLMVYLPDKLNDMTASLHIRRISMASNILYIPIFSMLVARIILAFSEKMGREIFGESFLTTLRIRLEKSCLTTEHTFAVSLSVITLLIVLLIKSANFKTFKEFWVFDPVGYKHSLPKDLSSSFVRHTKIPISSLIEICDWIKGNSPENAAIINPAYIRPFRTCTKRQAFIEEKVDGNSSIVDRKFATLFYERFADIHLGLSYNDFPGEPANEEDLYHVMQQRFLSLGEDKIENLKEKYPGYQYFLTEKGHKLPYPVLHQNAHFILYDLGATKK